VRFTVVLHREARAEAVAALSYLAAHASPDVAHAWYDAFEAAIASLETMPARCPYARERGERPDLDLRQATVGSHRLIFAVKGSTVHVLHVRHGAQDDLDDSEARAANPGLS